jgi:hypothetical protein
MLDTLKYIKKIYDSQYNSCIETLELEFKNYKYKIMEDLLTQISKDRNIPFKDLKRTYLDKENKDISKDKKAQTKELRSPKKSPNKQDTLVIDSDSDISFKR